MGTAVIIVGGLLGWIFGILLFMLFFLPLFVGLPVAVLRLAKGSLTWKGVGYLALTGFVGFIFLVVPASILELKVPPQGIGREFLDVFLRYGTSAGFLTMLGLAILYKEMRHNLKNNLNMIMGRYMTAAAQRKFEEEFNKSIDRRLSDED